MSGDYTDEHLTRAEGPTSFNALLFGGGANPTSGFQDQFVTRTLTFNNVFSLNWLKSFGKTYGRSWSLHRIFQSALQKIWFQTKWIKS